MSELSVRVGKKTREADGVFSFELVALQGELLPAFTAGAHIDLHVAGNLVRQYSLCNAPTERHRYLIAVLLEPSSRGGSEAMHALDEGAVVQISAPRNHFELSKGHPALLLAGGIGITPILCMAEQLHAAGEAFEMHYCTRAPERAAFKRRIEESDFADHVTLHFDTGPDKQKMSIADTLAAAQPNTHLYVCGPPGFISHVLDAAKAAGWQDERVHREFFAAPVTATVTADAPFEVQVASSQLKFVVPSNRTILEVLTEHGMEIPVSCEAGVCGTCVTRVLSGVPDHRDVYMTDAEHLKNDQVTVCCSRSKSALLVLDL